MSGAPQGSNLVLLLFLLFIKDLPFTCETHVYAVDAKFFCSVNSIQDCLLLQDDLAR